MAAILDTLVPARRREKRRIMALEERLSTRWGDPDISAPISGGWSQLAPTDEETSISQSPLSLDSTAQVVTDTQKLGVEKQSDESRQLASMNITIPLPWYSSKKNHNRSSSLTQEASSSLARKDQTVAGPNSQKTAAFPAPVVWKPASETYNKELETLSSLANPTRSTTPAVVFKPASKEYKKALDHMVQPSAQTSEDSVSKQETTVEKHITDRASPSPSQNHMHTETEVHPTQGEAPDRPNVDNSTTPTPSMSSGTTPDTTSTATSPVTEDIVKDLADIGFSHSPALRQDRWGRSSSYGPSRRINRESTSSTSSDGSSILSPKGLYLSTMPSGGYYNNLAEEYKQIAKAMEEAAVAEYGKKLMEKSGQHPGRGRVRGGSLERIPALNRQSGRGRSSRDVCYDHSLDKISELRPTSSKAQTENPGRRNSGIRRNMSADRARPESRGRVKNASGERNRGISADGSRTLSKDVARFPPQELVPKDEELWG